jgi:hypothetical protein
VVSSQAPWKLVGARSFTSLVVVVISLGLSNGKGLEGSLVGVGDNKNGAFLGSDVLGDL